MMPEEWPIAVLAADQNAPARREGRGRLSTVRIDFFLDPAERLTEQERALMTAMLHCLVGDIADEVRAVLPNVAIAANDDRNLAIVSELLGAGLLNRIGLVQRLLRRADEERIATGAKARIGRRDARVVQGLVSHSDGAVAAAAMALIIGRGRRRDRFGQCLLHFDDLPREEARVLVQAVAAALRAELAARTAKADADRLLTTATVQLLASHDPGGSLENLSATLVRLLDEEGDLDEALIGAAGIEGEMNFIAHAIARRSGISGDIALDELRSGDGTRVMALLRMGSVRRETAAGLLAGIGDLLGIADAGQAIARFDRMSDADVAEALSWLTADRAYKQGVATMGTNDGQRTV